VGQFEKVEMPKRWLSATAVTDLAAIRGRIAVTTLRKGSLLQTDMIVKRPELSAGQQEMAILIDASTGVAGKITPGAMVNIYATFKNKDPKLPDESWVITQNAKVLDVGKLTPFDSNSDSATSSRRVESEAVPITFALNNLDSQRVAYAESFATHVRLALIAPGSEVTVDPKDRTYTLPEDK
jgi:pilus assembly protein CpaB